MLPLVFIYFLAKHKCVFPSCYSELKELEGSLGRVTLTRPWRLVIYTSSFVCFNLSVGLWNVCVSKCECSWEGGGVLFALNWLPASYFFIILFFLFACAEQLASWLYQEAVSSRGYFNFIGFKEYREEVFTLAPQYNRICQHDPF